VIQVIRRFAFAAAFALPVVMSAGTAFAQKPGGILKMYTLDSPASMSIHEEGTVSVAGPMMAVFNNLVIFDQQIKQNSLQSIVPDLATGWSWSEDATALTFALRKDVKWQTIHRRGCQMHLGPVARKGDRQAAGQSP